MQDFEEGEEYVPNARVLANGDDLGRSLHGEGAMDSTRDSNELTLKVTS